MRVNIVKANSPVCFEALLYPDDICPVTGVTFYTLDVDINNYYHVYDIISDPALVSRTGQIVIVRHEKDRRFYRARVENIIQRSSGYELLLYLVDLAEKTTSAINCVRPIDDQFLKHVHRAMTLILPGINPCSCKLDVTTMKAEYRESKEWDTSAKNLITGLLKKYRSARFTTTKTEKTGELHGKLYLENNDDCICVNELLVKEKYGVLVSDNDVTRNSDESESCSELALGASASTYSGSDENRLPSTSRQPPRTHARGVLEWLEMQRELAIKAQKTDSDEDDLGLSPACVDSVDLNSSFHHSDVTDKLKTPPRIPVAAPCTTFVPRKSYSPDFPRQSSSPKRINSAHKPQFCFSPEARKMSASSVSLASSSGSRGVSRGTQYEPPDTCSQNDNRGCSQNQPSKGIETYIPEELPRSVSPVSVCSSRPASRTHQLPSRIQKMLNRKAPSQTCESAGMVDIKSPELPEPKCSRDLALAKYVEINMHKESTPSISPTGMPTSRPTSRAQQLPSRIQNILNRKNPSQTSKSTKTLDVRSPEMLDFELECNRVPDTPNKVGCIGHSPEYPKTSTILKAKCDRNPESSKVVTSCASHAYDTKCPKAASTDVPVESQKSENPECPSSASRSLDTAKTFQAPCRIPFGRGFPLKGISNPLSYSRPGSITPTPASSVISAIENKPGSESTAVKSKTLTDNTSSKAINHLPSTVYPVTSVRNNMVDPLGLLDEVPYRKILICGRLAPKPVLNMPQFSDVVLRRLTVMKFKAPTVIQSFAWPAIMRGRNVVAVSGPQSGKSMTYLPALVSRLSDSILYSKIPQGNEPLVLVVCSSWQSAKRVFDLCQFVIEGVVNVRALLIHGGGYDETHKIELMNGCDILIATPCALLRLLSYEGIKPTSLDRLCHLVLDDADVLTEEFTDQIRQIMRGCAVAVKKRGKAEVPCQIMAFGTKWTNGLQSFLTNVLPDPLLYCTLFHESLIYAGIKILMHPCYEDQKDDHLLELIKPALKHNNVKTVVCTFSADVADRLHKILAFLSKHVFVAHEEMSRSEVKAVRKQWHGSHSANHHPILIATDACLDELDIEDAMHVIHYDIPEMTKTQFGYRFSCLLEYMRRSLTGNTANIASECLSHIIVTDKCVQQAHTLISLAERLSCDIPPALKSLAKGYYEGREEEKQPIPLCHKLKLFGHCPNQYRCSERHMLLENVDKPNVNLPRGSIIWACISNVRNASHFFGRILKRQLRDGSWEDGYQQFMELNIDLNIHFSKLANRRPHGLPMIGDICAIYGKDGSYFRVRILSQPLVKGVNNVREVGIMFIDVGTLTSVKVSDLLKLPTKLQLVPPQAIEIFLTNIRPVDKDQEFTVKAYRMVQELLLNKEIVGTVALSLGSTLWLKDIIQQTRLALTGKYVYEFDLRQKLMHEFAMHNPTHLGVLEKFCNGIFELEMPINIPSPNKNSVVLAPKVGIEPEYAFLPLGDLELVSICSVFTPGKFYLTKRQSLECLELLMDDLTKYFQEKSPAPLKDIFEGLLCAARSPSTDDYYRSRVLQTFDEDKVSIFWADYGKIHTVKRNDIFSLPDKFLTKLPLQAIECTLANVVPIGENWTENASNFMWEQNLEEDGSYKELLVKALQKTSNSKQSGNSYEVELFDPSDRVSDVSFAELLCGANHAQLVPPVEQEVNSLECAGDISVDQIQDWKELDSSAESKPCESPIQEEEFEPSESFIQEEESKPCEHPIQEEQSNKHVKESVHPLVIWWDTKNDVHLKIHISGVEKHTIDVQPTRFLFKAKVKELYSVDINLFDEVDTQRHSACVSENFVKVVIPKEKQGKKWPRLTKETIKTRLIQIDYDHVVLNSSDEEKESDLEEEYEWNTKDKGKTAANDGKNYCPLDVAELEDSNGESTDSDCSESEKNYHDDYSIF